MATLCKALRVKIGLRGSGGHAYPNFNKIDPALRGNVDWSHFVDKFGGWLYDNVEGHNPNGIWIGYVLVPKPFANEAVRLFPAQCKIVDEPTVSTFYENRSNIGQPAVLEDAETIAKIKNKADLGLPQDQDDLDALDIDHPARGRRKNRVKTWLGFKTTKSIAIDPTP